MGLEKFIGLPNGANNKFSKNGYKANSPDRNNAYNIIDSGNITMKGVPHPVYGIDELGNEQIMTPGGEYQFPGNYVMEIPMAQVGLQVDSLNNFNREKASWEKIKGTDDPSYEELLNMDLTWKADGRYGNTKQSKRDVGYVGLYDTMIKDGPDYIPVSVPVHKKPQPPRRKGENIEKIQPRGLKSGPNENTINTTPYKGVPKLPEPTIIGYTQAWDPANKKWIQEPQYQTIAEADANRYKKDGGAYQDLELTNEQIEEYRAGGYVVEELQQAQDGTYDYSHIAKPKFNLTRQDSATLYNTGKSAYDYFNKINKGLAEDASGLIGTDWSAVPYTNKTEYNRRHKEWKDISKKLTGHNYALDLHKMFKLKKEPRIEKVKPRGLKVDQGMPTINATPREGVPALPERTIIGYTQKWNSVLKKWEQEPVTQVIAERAYGGDIQTGGGYNYNEINSLEEGGGIHIKDSKKGTFTAAATKHGKSVQAFANQVLGNKDNYSPAMVKKANFARNASRWNKQEGGEYIDVELTMEEIAELRGKGIRVDEL